MKMRTKTHWVNIAIPDNLADLVDKAVSDKFGYRSRADFVNDAVRMRLRDLGFKI